MIVICYKIFLMDGTISENFESIPSIADDWNAVNQLAQISRQLMNGTLTVPGGLTVSGTITGTTLNIGSTNVGTTLSSLQSQISSLTATVNTNNTTLTSSINSTNTNLSSRISTLEGKLPLGGAAVQYGGSVAFQRKRENRWVSGDGVQDTQGVWANWRVWQDNGASG